MRGMILETKNLSIGYSAKNKSKILQSSLNLKLKSGNLVSLVGPNGVGKSTLLKTLCKLIRPIEGEICIKGESLESAESNALAMVLTQGIYAHGFTVFDVVSLGRYPYTNWIGKMTAHDVQIIENAMASVHIGHLAHQSAMQLSDGEKQRMMIAKALAQETPLIILDEPTSHLDLVNKIEIIHLLHQLSRQHSKAILMVTHELDLAIQNSDEMWIMSQEGIQMGCPEDLILDGRLQRLFQSNQIVFNQDQLHFQRNHLLSKPIWMKSNSDGLAEKLSFQLLQKLGYYLEAGYKDCQLELLSNQTWQITKNNSVFQFENLAGVQDFLRNN